MKNTKQKIIAAISILFMLILSPSINANIDGLPAPTREEISEFQYADEYIDTVDDNEVKIVNAGGPYQKTIGGVVYFHGTFNSAFFPNVTGYIWDFGDESEPYQHDFEPDIPSSSGSIIECPAQHLYPEINGYTAILTINHDTEFIDPQVGHTDITYGNLMYPRENQDSAQVHIVSPYNDWAILNELPADNEDKFKKEIWDKDQDKWVDEYAEVDEGGPIRFRLTFDQDRAYEDIVVKDRLPATVRFISATLTPDIIETEIYFDHTTNTYVPYTLLTWNIGDMSSHEEIDIEIDGIVEYLDRSYFDLPDDSYSIGYPTRNYAELRGTGRSPGCGNRYTVKHGADATFVIIPSPNEPEIEIKKYVKLNCNGEYDDIEIIANRGDWVTFKLEITNNGDYPVDATVTDHLPDGLTYSNNALVNGVPREPVFIDDYNFFWFGTLNPDEKVIITFRADVDGCGVLTNIAEVEYTYQDKVYTDQDSATVIVRCVVDIDIEKLVREDCSDKWEENINVGVNDEVVFKLLVKNIGDTALDIMVRDILPENLVYVLGSANYTPSVNDMTLSWFFENVDPSDPPIEIVFNARAVEVGLGINWGIAESRHEGVSDEDNATVNVLTDDPGVHIHKTVLCNPRPHQMGGIIGRPEDDTAEQWSAYPASNGWCETTTVHLNDIVIFNLTIEYILGCGYKLKDIIVRDVLPDCLEFTGNAIVIYDGIIIPGYSGVSGQTIFWNLTDDFGVVLSNREWVGQPVVYIEFEATAVGCTNECGEENTAYVSALETCCGVPRRDSDTATVIVDCEEPPEIVINKTVWNGTEWADYTQVNVGDTVEFKILITNIGNVDLHQVIVEDTLPSYLTYNYDANYTPVTATDQFIRWSGTITSGETVEITFTATANAPGTQECNYAIANTQEGPFDEDIACVDVVERPNPDIILHKYVKHLGQWAGYTEVNVGDTVEFKIVVKNIGNIDLHQVIVEDTLPSYLTYNYDANYTPDTATDQFIRWSGTLTIGETVEITFTATANAPGTTACNTAVVTTQEGPFDEDIACVNVLCEPGISVDKKVKKKCCGEYSDSIIVNKGDWVTFQITVTNNGDVPLNITVTDTLPDCLDYTNNAKVDGQPFEPKVISECCCCGCIDYYIWEIGLLDPEETVVITFTADTDDCCGEVVNSANAVGYIEPQHIDFVVGRDQAVVSVLCPPDLEVTKTVFNGCSWSDETTADIGEKVRFRVIVKNTGLSPLYTFTAVDTLPAGLTYADNATVDGVDDEPDEIILNPDGTTTLIWNFLCTTCDSRCQLYPVIPDPCGGNGVFVPCDPECCGLCSPDPNDPNPQPHVVGVQCGYCAEIPTCDKRCETVNMFDPCVQEPDWVSCSPKCCWGDGPVPISAVCGYNLGDFIEKPIPIYEACSYDSNDIMATSSIVPQPCCPCECFELYPGEIIVIEFDAIVDDCGVLENNMLVTSNDKITDEQLIDEDNATVNVSCDPGISIDKKVKKNCCGEYSDYIPVHEDDWVTFKLEVTNSGDVPLDITVSDSLPLGFTYDNNAMVDDNPHEPDDIITPLNGHIIYIWNVGVVEPGQTVVITFRTVTDNCGGLVNSASATAFYNDQKLSDSDVAEVFVLCPAINVLKEADQSMIHSGDTVTYTYTVTNTGNVPLTNIVVQDDQGLIPVYVSGDTNHNNWLDLDETGIYTASTQLYEDTTNIGNVTGEDELGEEVYDEDTEFVEVTVCPPEIDLDLDKKVKWNCCGQYGDYIYAHIDDWVTFKIEVTNTGNVPLDIEVCDFLPAGLQYADNAMVDSVPQEPVEGCWALNDVAPGQTVVITFRAYAVECGEQVNSVSAVGTYEQYDPVGKRNIATVYVLCSDIEIIKEVDNPVIHEGDLVTYTYTVTNTGNHHLKNVILTDDKIPGVSYVSGDTNDDDWLDLDETWIYTASAQLYENTTNTANVTAEDEMNKKVYDEDTEFVEVSECQQPPELDIKIVKKVKRNCCGDYGDIAYVHQGDGVTFELEVINTGEEALLVTVQDILPLIAGLIYNDNSYVDGVPVSPEIDSFAIIWDIGTVNPGQTVVITFEAIVTDDECGTVRNEALAFGKYDDYPSVSNTSTADVFVLCPGIYIDKTADPTVTNPGNFVTYTYEITNGGNTALTNIVVDDDQGLTPVYVSGDINDDDWLDLDETWIYEAITTIYEDTTNVGNVTSEDELGMVVYAEDDAFVDVEECGCTPEISIDKTVFDGETWFDHLVTTEEGPIDVTFKIIVQNTGTCDLENITIVDTMECGIENPRDITGGIPYDIMDYQITWNVPGTISHLGAPIIITFDATVYISSRNNVTVDADSIDDETHVSSDDQVAITFDQPGVNHPPYKPVTPTPEDEQENISVNPTLGIYVEDPDGDMLDVYFYNASDDSLIGSVSVSSGSHAELVWNNLEFETGYSWYAVAYDGEYTNTSDVFSFSTKADTDAAPTISIITPEENSIYFRNTHFPAAFLQRTIIIGPINITAEADDEDGEVTNVDFIIDGEVKNSSGAEPHYYYWNEVYVGACTIKVKATDDMGNTAEDTIEVFVINLGRAN